MQQFRCAGHGFSKSIRHSVFSRMPLSRSPAPDHALVGTAIMELSPAARTGVPGEAGAAPTLCAGHDVPEISGQRALDRVPGDITERAAGYLGMIVIGAVVLPAAIWFGRKPARPWGIGLPPWSPPRPPW